MIDSLLLHFTFSYIYIYIYIYIHIFGVRIFTRQWWAYDGSKLWANWVPDQTIRRRLQYPTDRIARCGLVYGPKLGVSPLMGSGHCAQGCFRKGAYFGYIEWLDQILQSYSSEASGSACSEPQVSCFINVWFQCRNLWRSWRRLYKLHQCKNALQILCNQNLMI